MKPAVAPIMALHATSKGFAYALFTSPFSPHDWGGVGVQGHKSISCLNKLDRLLDRFEPDTLIFEDFERSRSARKQRIVRLYRAMASAAAARSIDVIVYTRAQIQACFVGVGARTRQEIADAIARQFDVFRHRLPKPRRPWQSESRGMALFCAVALILAHYHLGASRLFDDLLSNVENASEEDQE